MTGKATKTVSALTLLAVSSCAGTVLLLGGASGGAAAACAPTTPRTGTTPATLPAGTTPTGTAPPAAGTLPAAIGGYAGEQVSNAAQIVLAAQALGIDGQGQAIGLMTAIGESGLHNLDHGDQAGPDSRGIFQQRDNGAWGSYADRMTPSTAATNFFTKLLTVPGWHDMAPSAAAHAVQRNADPFYYAPFWTDAVTLAATLGTDPDLASKVPAAGDQTCAPGATGTYTGTGPDAGTGFTTQACSVTPDPSTGRGCLTPRMANLQAQLAAQGWQVSCWDPHLQNPTSDHPLGKACDVFPGTGGMLPSPAEKATGDALAAALQASAAQTGLNYLIWSGQIWSVQRAAEGWRPYNGGGAYDPASITGGHYDHVHISVY
jgi:hypothetical protein